MDSKIETTIRIVMETVHAWIAGRIFVAWQCKCNTILVKMSVERCCPMDSDDTQIQTGLVDDMKTSPAPSQN